MFGRKARRIRELEAENADLKQEMRELKDVLKSTMKEPPKKLTFREGQGRDAVRKTVDRMGTKKIKKKKPSAIIGRRVETRENNDDGPGFGTGLVTGIALSNILSDDDHHSSKEDSFSGGGGEFGGAGASGGWSGEDSGGGGGGGGGGDE